VTYKKAKCYVIKQLKKLKNFLLDYYIQTKTKTKTKIKMFSNILIKRAFQTKMTKRTFQTRMCREKLQLHFRTKATDASVSKKLGEKTKFKSFKELFMTDEQELAILGWKYGWRVGGFLLPFAMLYSKETYYKKLALSKPDKIEHLALTNSDLAMIIGLGVPGGMLAGSVSCFGAGYSITGLYNFGSWLQSKVLFTRFLPYAILFTVPVTIYGKLFV
jgi:hypothetical protein